MAAANPEVEFHMNDFLDQCVVLLNDHYDSKFPNLPRPQVKVKAGGKYYKVYQDCGEYHKSVWFFVSKEDGSIWKAASWRALILAIRCISKFHQAKAGLTEYQPVE